MEEEINMTAPADAGGAVAEGDGQKKRLPPGVTPDMVSTKGKYCEDCYYGGKGKKATGCNWYLWTGIRRGCPVGWCNHHTPANGRERPKTGFKASHSYYAGGRKKDGETDKKEDF